MKYIIEIEDEPNIDTFDKAKYYKCKQVSYWYVSENIKNKLTPYTEPDRKAIEDEVWEFVVKCLKMDGDDFYEIFNSCDVMCLTNFSYQEAKEKYEAWKKQKDEVSVGDEVEYEYGGEKIRFIVTGVKDSTAYGFRQIMEYEDVSDVGEYCDVDVLQKTGRRFPEVVELLKKMRDAE